MEGLLQSFNSCWDQLLYWVKETSLKITKVETLGRDELHIPDHLNGKLTTICPKVLHLVQCFVLILFHGDSPDGNVAGQRGN